MTSTRQIIDAHDRYLTANYPRYPIAILDGAGCILHDADGREYLDLFSGFGAGILGHCHPDIVAAVTRQANKLWHVGNLLHTGPQVELARHVAEKGFGGKSFFCHSGSDANEAAFKIARLHGRAAGKDRFEIIAATASFHGRGFAAMMATGQDKVRKGYEPFLQGFKHVPYNDLPAMTAAIDNRTAAIILEPIQGEGGVHVPTEAYMKGVRKLCDDRDLLLICDEVWTGCGRTGKWFAYQHYDIEPDIMTLGKAVGVGLPVGVMCAGERAAKYFDHKHYGGVPHATTLGGNCVSMAAAARLFEVLERENLVERAATLGQTIIDRLTAFAGDTPLIKQVRGKGLFIGLELDPTAPGAWFRNAADVVDKALQQGLMINAAQANVVRLAPPLVITDEQLDTGLRLLEEIIRG